MRTLAVTQNVTLDGRVEMLDPWFDPTDQDPELAAELAPARREVVRPRRHLRGLRGGGR